MAVSSIQTKTLLSAGAVVDSEVGIAVGTGVGVGVGSGVEVGVGFGVGTAVGTGIEVGVGSGVGVGVGSRVGVTVDAGVGTDIGAGVGADAGSEAGTVVETATYELSIYVSALSDGDPSVVEPKPAKLSMHARVDNPASLKVFLGDFRLISFMTASKINTGMQRRLIRNKNANTVFISFLLL